MNKEKRQRAKTTKTVTGNGIKSKLIQFPLPLYKQIEKSAFKNGRTVSGEIRELLKSALRK